MADAAKSPFERQRFRIHAVVGNDCVQPVDFGLIDVVMISHGFMIGYSLAFRFFLFVRYRTLHILNRCDGLFVKGLFIAHMHINLNEGFQHPFCQ